MTLVSARDVNGNNMYALQLVRSGLAASDAAEGEILGVCRATTSVVRTCLISTVGLGRQFKRSGLCQRPIELDIDITKLPQGTTTPRFD